ncbi:MAG: hypothetical protein O3A01_08185 [bacterium]|nr:hypothetical protein [bacterium]
MAENNNIKNQHIHDVKGDKRKENKIRGTEDDHDKFTKELNNINALINTYIDPSSPEASSVEGVGSMTDSDRREKEKRVTAGLEQKQGIVETPAQRIRNRDQMQRQKVQGARATGQTNDAIKAGEDV